MGKGKKKAATKQKPFKLDMSFEEAIRRSIQTKISKKEVPLGMEFKQTEFKLIAFRYNPDIIKLVFDLNETGAHLITTESPTFQPAIKRGRFGNIPLAWLTLKWVNNATNAEGVEVIYHEVEDTRQFNPKQYSYEAIRATFARSFDAMHEQYEELCQQIGIQGDILQPSLEEFESYCRGIEQFLKASLG